MNRKATFKRIKRRFKKKLYNFLVTINEADFSKFRPLCYLLLITAMLLALSKLPTTETTNANSSQVAFGTEYATAVRTAISSTTNTPIHVVALFLPQNLSKESITETLETEVLYSFYLTGTELAHLAEGAVTTITKDKSLHLDGLNFTYHKNRLPFNRVTELSTSAGEAISDNQLYHIVSTEDIFALFHYISYRSIGIMQVYPKNADGTLLSDYQEVIVNETGAPFTIGTSLSHITRAKEVVSCTPSIVTTQKGFNLIDLTKEPNQLTMCVGALFVAFITLLWYIVPRINRIRLWFRIYRIHSKKRSTHTLLYGLRKRF